MNNITKQTKKHIRFNEIKEKKKITQLEKRTYMQANEIKQFVYKMFDKHDEVVYIGQTSNIDNRMSAHCIFREDFIPNNSITIPLDKLDEIKRVEFAVVDNKYFSSIYELHYICKHQPIYNKTIKYYSSKLLDLPELIWYEYITVDKYNKARSLYCILNKSSIIKPNNPIDRSVLYKQIVSDIEKEC